jgi:hypothetical protein
MATDFVKLYMALGFSEDQARRYVEAGQGVKVTMSKNGVWVEWLPPIESVDVKEAE